MTTHYTAQGLASLGRHGDTMLVHMSPHEVAGLNYLAKKQGTKLTVNPETGLPEAFSLGGFFSSFLPMIAGMAFAPETGGFSMAPLLAGAATGAGLAAVKGEDPLMGTLMGGLGGYGGGQLGPALSAAQPGGWVAGQAIKGAANPLMDTTVNTALSGAQNSMMANPLITNAAQNINAAGLGAGSGVGFMDKATQNVMNAGSGLKNIATGQPGAWDAFKAAGGTPMQLAMPVGGAVLGGLEPSDIYGEPIKPSNKGKYDPYATLNLSGDTGLRLVAEGGYIDSKDYAMGGTVTTGGLSDLYNTTDNITNPQLSRDGYGIGRLNSLAQQQSLNQAQTMGYADGGDVSMNLEALPSLNLNRGTASSNKITGDGGFNFDLVPMMNTLQIASKAPYLPVQDIEGNVIKAPNPILAGRPKAITGAIENVFSRMAKGGSINYAMGGPVSFADGGDANKEALGLAPIDQSIGIASLTPTTPSQAMSGNQVQNAATALSGTQGQPAANDGSIITQVATKLQQDPNYQPANPIEASIVKQLKGTDQQGQTQQGLGSLGPAQPSQPMAPTYNPSVAMGPTYYAGMNAPRGYAEGGYLDGPGTGLSDSIPATIEGKQPARLADGEFVVSSDVVSALGEGSSKAGSKRLYAMMDRIRQKAHGKKKQINKVPESILPA